MSATLIRLDQYTTGDPERGAPLWKQVLWFFCGNPLVQTNLLPFSGFKVWLLRQFGATIGTGVRIKPGVRVKFPWRLTIGDHCWIGEDVWIDNIAPITLESHVCLSQAVFLCTGNHSWSDPSFTWISQPIHLAQGSWIAAKAMVGPGVTVGAGAVLCLGSVTGKSLEPMTIYAGNPAQPIRQRVIKSARGENSPKLDVAV
jgi:putative colanic acid biosynthesis acetyltransferase WcaF